MTNDELDGKRDGQRDGQRDRRGEGRDERDVREERVSARRRFLRDGLIATSLLAIAPRSLRAQAVDCAPTTTDLYGQGPFYSAGAPMRSILASQEEPGERIFITGTVYARDCITPLDNVVLDIWHADDTGCYSRFGNCENPTGDDYKLRGLMRTGASGAFGLESVKPGLYLNGSQYRPSHIHLKARATGVPELITQLYFEGDEFIDDDLAASHPSAAGRIISMVPGEGGLYGTFDLVLNVDPGTSAAPSAYDAGVTRLRQNHPNPFGESTTIPFHLSEKGGVLLAIYDVRGREMAVLLDGDHGAGAHAVQWNGTDRKGNRLAAGSYVYRLQTEKCDESRILTLL